MRFHWVLVMLAAGAAAASARPSRAAACSCLPDAFARADPADGATDVARNHAVVVEGFFEPDSLELTTQDGTPVPFELDAGPESGCKGMIWAELIPTSPYDARATYVVRAKPVYPESATNQITFTTGDWSWAEREDHPPLQAKVSMVEGYPLDGGGCATGTIMSCATLNEFENVEVIARKDGEIILRWILSANDPNFVFEVVPDCLEFRRREPTGARSPVLEVCGDALHVRPYRESELRGRDFFCQDGLVGAGFNARSNSPRAGAGEDAGTEPDPDVNAADSDGHHEAEPDRADGRAGTNGAAGANASPASAPAGDAPPAAAGEQRHYGCAAVLGPRAPSALASCVLLLFAIALARHNALACWRARRGRKACPRSLAVRASGR